MASQLSHRLAEREKAHRFAFEAVIDDICNLNWTKLNSGDLIEVAWAYYFFSTQFRENLEIARTLLPDDERLKELEQGERDTDNLSPWPGVAAPGEKMHHDEFMRRTLALKPIPAAKRAKLAALGRDYLGHARAMNKETRAMSIASYEDGGLEAVFRAILTAPDWNGPLQEAFQHFLIQHVKFDSDPDAGHGALCRHLKPDDRILPLWNAFRQILIESAAGLTA